MSLMFIADVPQVRRPGSFGKRGLRPQEVGRGAGGGDVPPGRPREGPRAPLRLPADGPGQGRDHKEPARGEMGDGDWGRDHNEPARGEMGDGDLGDLGDMEGMHSSPPYSLPNIKSVLTFRHNFDRLSSSRPSPCLCSSPWLPRRLPFSRCCIKSRSTTPHGGILSRRLMTEECTSLYYKL